jgi:hypothetical protein
MRVIIPRLRFCTIHHTWVIIRDFVVPSLSLIVSPEAINPVAMGTTRAKQYAMLHASSQGCMLGDKVMCVQLHGDAAFTGQGIVMESLGLSTIGALYLPESVF